MFSKILVPLDGSESAERALPYAEAIGLRLNSTLILVRAATTHPLRATYPTEPARDAVHVLLGLAHDLLRGLTERGVTVETAVPYAEPVEGVLSELRRWEADLIVMSTHGRSGLGRWVYGSVAEHVLAHSPAPMLLVRAWRAKAEPVSLGEQPRIVVPLDGSQFAEEALPAAAGLAEALGGELVLLRAVNAGSANVAIDTAGLGYVLSPGPIVSELAESEVKRLTEEAEEYLSQVAPSTSRFRTEVRTGSAVEAIVEATREHDASMVVMTTHGRTGLGRVLLGSVADGVLRQGEIPLLLVRPRTLVATHAEVGAPGDVPSW